MIDFFDKQYNKIEEKNEFLANIKYYGLLRFIIRLLVNVITPLYFFFTTYMKESISLEENNIDNEPKIIVSLTSFPPRIKRVWLVIETILRQTRKPDKIILWLSQKQFPKLKDLPKNLLKQRRRGLEIRLVEDDLKSHKKYYYALKEYPDAYLIMIDDDIFYKSNMIENLFNYSSLFPDDIIAQYSKKIKRKGDNLKSYISWPALKEECEHNNRLFFGTGGGILCPPESFYSDVLNKELFMELTPTADDIWLNAMAKLKNTRITQTNYSSDYLPVLNFNDVTLWEKNVGMNKNDKQIESVNSYYKKTKNIVPF